MADSSLLDRLKAEHAALTEKRTLDRPLPGYSTLVVRFRAVGRETLTEITDRVERADAAGGDEAGASRAFDADLLINLCEGIFERQGDELVPLNTLLEEWGDEPITFDPRLAEAVGATLPDDPAERTARSVVFAVLRVDEPDTGNDIRFGRLARDVWEWLHSGFAQADQDF